MTIKQISTFLENKPGRLVKLTPQPAENNIDLRALSLADTSDFGILRIIVSETEKALEVLKEGGYVAKITPVLAVEIEDKPGGMSAVLDILAKNGINLEYTYAFMTRHAGSAYMICRVGDNEKAEALLAEAGIKTAEQSEIAKL